MSGSEELLDAADLTSRLELELTALANLLGALPEADALCPETVRGLSLLLSRLGQDTGRVAESLAHLLRHPAA